ncbi:hypothetical protein VQ042_01220 [Aurantimonas sp. A2-1-M11]|uniref:hypothetical protein n=1 Tax=Aurantimonas sp. A2-1-M11 TaxID=3113712 RepID=UPI002F9246FE
MSAEINGFGLVIYHDGASTICGFLDGSPVLQPVRIEATPTGRRIRFSEGKGELRRLGDVFVADPDLAGFVAAAINEKLAGDGGHQ